jgi:DNA-binding NtrC family response regulator
MPGWDGLATLRRLRQESPATEVVLLTGHGTIEGAVEGMRAGAFDYLTKPCRLAELSAVLRRAVERRELERENARLRWLAAGRGESAEVIASSPAMAALFQKLERVAAAEAPVLVQGESGTGKELVARALHRLSPRRDKPFVAINCSAIPETLFESEVFGHQRGAFTGANERRIGLVEAADGGVIFLDEIAEMSPGAQAKILRAIETGEIRRVGESRSIRVDVRVVAATNRDLQAEVASGRFREDLYYRLAAVTLRVPPLRERVDDIEPLARHFLRTLPVRERRVHDISPQALAALRAYPWPGNVRELRNCVEAVLILAPGPRIELEDLPPSVRGKGKADFPVTEGAAIRPLDEVVEDYVRFVLRRCGGNKSQASRLLGIDPKTISRYLKRAEGESPEGP